MVGSPRLLIAVGLFLPLSLTTVLLVPAQAKKLARGQTTEPPAHTWAALGDSYSSGPLIPHQTFDPLGCLRSDRDYAHLAAAATGYQLTDVSCSGATVSDLNSPQHTAIGRNPPQLSSLSAQDGIVTLGIGGGDLDFAKLIKNCVAATPWGPTAVGRTCKRHYDPHGHDTLAAEIRALQTTVEAALVQVHTRAPRARVFVVGYPAVLPAAGSGCWPRMPLTATDVRYLRATEVELNAMLGAAAAAKGATYVDTYTQSTSHNACTKETTRWVEPVIPGSLALPMHPNAKGQAAVASAVESAVLDSAAA